MDDPKYVHNMQIVNDKNQHVKGNREESEDEERKIPGFIRRVQHAKNKENGRGKRQGRKLDK